MNPPVCAAPGVGGEKNRVTSCADTTPSSDGTARKSESDAVTFNAWISSTLFPACRYCCALGMKKSDGMIACAFGCVPVALELNVGDPGALIAATWWPLIHATKP